MGKIPYPQWCTYPTMVPLVLTHGAHGHIWVTMHRSSCLFLWTFCASPLGLFRHCRGSLLCATSGQRSGPRSQAPSLKPRNGLVMGKGDSLKRHVHVSKCTGGHFHRGRCVAAAGPARPGPRSRPGPDEASSMASRPLDLGVSQKRGTPLWMVRKWRKTGS